MRQIKFRGKRIDNGEWVYGDYVYDNNKDRAYIHNSTGDAPEHFQEVIPATVGQYTGLQDKNGKEIYEGDLLKMAVDSAFLLWKVVFKNGCFGIRNISIDGYENHAEFHPINSEYYFSDREITGNIHEPQITTDV